MFRRARFVFAALVAVVMLGAAAVSVASAAEMVLPEFTVLQAGTSTSGKGELTVEGGASVKCGKDKGLFLFNTGTNKLGTYTLEFKECTQGGEPCLSLGGSAETIIVSGEWHLVLEIKAGAKPEHLWLVLFLLPSSDPHIECLKSAVHLLLVLGSILVLIEPAGKKTKEFKIFAEAPKGVQKEVTYENNKAEQVEVRLEVSQEGGKQKKAGLESAENVLKFEKETEIKN